MKQMIGILLDPETFANVPGKRTGYERIDLYNKAAEKLELKPFYMALHNTGKSYSLGYVYTDGRYKRVRRSIPKIIHNRAMTLSPSGKNKLSKLAQSSIIFNRINRFGKYGIYRLLYRNRSLRSYLPYSVKYSKPNLIKTMKLFSEIFIKPTSGSVGSGIIKIMEKQSGYWNIYWKKGMPTQKTRLQTLAFIQRMVGTQAYLIQEAISLATYQGRPYDLRVSVQRGGTGQWQVTGMVGKVAGVGRHVTNVAKGGKVKRCEVLFQSGGLHIDGMKREVQRVSLEIAVYLGQNLPHLTDIGLDMGIDREGKVKFIEMNGRDQRITFKKAGMRNTFFNTYKTPLEYGLFLMKPKI
jgi:hypothetical protein